MAFLFATFRGGCCQRLRTETQRIPCSDKRAVQVIGVKASFSFYVILTCSASRRFERPFPPPPLPPCFASLKEVRHRTRPGRG